jgi:ParB family chromosome partitioning protein
MDDDRMNSLVVSIRAVGVLEPLLVRPAGDGVFEVVAGHRRLKASRIAGLAELPCIDLETDELADAVKIHENLEREDLSPSDEAIFYAELYEQRGEDVDVVAELVKKSRGHVESRLHLIRGDKHVFAALAAGKISIGVAEELNKFSREEDRLFHLDYCTRTGATVATARQWRLDANRRAELAPPAPAAEPSNPARTPEEEARLSLERTAFAGAAPWELDTSTEKRPCSMCAAELEAWKMLKKHLCPDCATVVWPALLKAFRGGEA